MARDTQDRENLLRDGVAMIQRGRLIIAGDEVVIGFRSEGQLSLYWDQDPVFQFDPSGCLRRVYWEGRRIKADSKRLVDLTPTRQAGQGAVRQLQLHGQPLSAAEQTGILLDLESRLQQIKGALQSDLKKHPRSEFVTVGETPDEMARRVIVWIEGLKFPLEIANDAQASQRG